MPIAIIDYGMANLRSVQKAFEQVGAAAQIISKPEQIDRADKIVLPGVGAFADAVRTLREHQLVDSILNHINRGKPFLGICLGLQMLVDVSYEDGEHQWALAIIPQGKMRSLSTSTSRLGLEGPAHGLEPASRFAAAADPADLLAGCGVYFVHSYHVVPDDLSIIATTTDYGGEFVSSIWRDNLLATQFHPEKSQKVGLQILANFAAM